MEFGLQCESIPKQRSGLPVVIKRQDFASPSPSACLASSLGSYLVSEASNGCRVYTSADLQSVSCIRFSRGHPGRPRHEGEIPGLWFDYHGRSRPSIAGQWLSEGGSTSLEEGEVISGITIWLSKGRKSFSERYYMGRVIRILISTSLRTVSFPDDFPLSTDELIVVRSQENRFEELVSDTCSVIFVCIDYQFFVSQCSRLSFGLLTMPGISHASSRVPSFLTGDLHVGIRGNSLRHARGLLHNELYGKDVLQRINLSL